MPDHRCELRRAGDGLWHVVYQGEQIVSAPRDPEPEACRILAARGVGGRVIFAHTHGTVSTGMDISGAAKAAKPTNPPGHKGRTASIAQKRGEAVDGMKRLDLQAANGGTNGETDSKTQEHGR